MKKIMLIAAFIAAFALVFTACDDGKKSSTDNTPSYTVTFNMNGVSISSAAIAPQTVKKGAAPEQPASPTATGFEFDEWYTTATGDTMFDFEAGITADTTVYAQWTESSDYYYAKFYDGTTLIAYVPVNKTTGDQIIPNTSIPANTPGTTDGKYASTNILFAGWFDDDEADLDADTAVDLTEALDDNITVYAQFYSALVVTEGGDINDVVKFYTFADSLEPDEIFNDDIYNAVVTLNGGPGRYNNTPAIQVKKDTGKGSQFYMQLLFDESVDLSTVKSFEMDWFSDTGNDAENIVISLFLGDDLEKALKNKKMMFPGPQYGTFTVDLGTMLWFDSKELWSIEVWMDKPKVAEDYATAYITRMEFTGTADPEPAKGSKIAATNISVATTATPVASQMTLTVPAGAATGGVVSAPWGDDAKKVWVFFDAPNKEVLTVEVKMKYTGSDAPWGGNFNWNTIIDATHEVAFEGSSDYITFVGNDGIVIEAIPIANFDGINTSTMKAITFWVAVATGYTLVLEEVNFYEEDKD